MLTQVVGHQACHLTAIDQLFLFQRDQELAGFVQRDIVARCPGNRLRIPVMLTNQSSNVTN